MKALPSSAPELLEEPAFQFELLVVDECQNIVASSGYRAGQALDPDLVQHPAGLPWIAVVLSNPPNVTRLHLDGHRSCPARGQVLVMGGDGPRERASGESPDSAELYDPSSGT